jgi:hypothetical protein
MSLFDVTFSDGATVRVQADTPTEAKYKALVVRHNTSTVVAARITKVIRIIYD